MRIVRFVAAGADQCRIHADDEFIGGFMREKSQVSNRLRRVCDRIRSPQQRWSAAFIVLTLFEFRVISYISAATDCMSPFRKRSHEKATFPKKFCRAISSGRLAFHPRLACLVFGGLSSHWRRTCHPIHAMS